MNKRKKDWMEDKSFLKAFSLFMAVLCWVAITTIQKPEQDRTVRDVPVDVEMQEDALNALSLEVVEISRETVSAVINGERGAVGQITPELLTATVRIGSEITGPGEYTLSLVPAARDDRYTLLRYTPATVTVTFDREETRIFDVETEVNGLAIAPGYIQDVSGIRVTPQQVSVKGPQKEVEKISRCVVTLELSNPLEATYARGDLPLTFLDEQGNALNLSGTHLKLDPNDGVQVIIPVLKTETLPLAFRFINVPDSFPDPLRAFDYTMSDEGVEVAGPVEQVDRYAEIQVGYIDLRTLDMGQSEFTFRVNMPSENMINRSDIESVTVLFDTSDWAETVITASQIELLNVPFDQTVTLMDNRVRNIRLTGLSDIIESLAADDVVVQVDLSERELSPGQHYYPVKITVPTKGEVWANGEYSVLIAVENVAVDE
jgi:Uncharacterized protein conserved in bacteria